MCRVDFHLASRGTRYKNLLLLLSVTTASQTLCLLCGALSWQQAYVVASSLTQQAALGTLQSVDAEAELQRAKLASGMMPLRTVQAGAALHLGASTYRYAGASSAGAFPPELGGLEGPPTPTQTLALGTPKIIYATRTHSQISQVVRELKRSGFAPRTAILGSRSQVRIRWW
jgi:hypothetical protein